MSRETRRVWWKLASAKPENRSRAPLALIGGAKAEPLKANGEASGAISVAACGHAYHC